MAVVCAQPMDLFKGDFLLILSGGHPTTFRVDLLPTLNTNLIPRPGRGRLSSNANYLCRRHNSSHNRIGVRPYNMLLAFSISIYPRRNEHTFSNHKRRNRFGKSNALNTVNGARGIGTIFSMYNYLIDQSPTIT